MHIHKPRFVTACVLALLAGCATTPKPDATIVTNSTDQVAAPPSPASTPTILRAESFLGDVSGTMDNTTRTEYLAAQQTAFDTGTKTSWHNQDLAAFGSIVVETGSLSSQYPGLDCKRYASTVWQLGKGQFVKGDACRQSDGTWLAMTREDPS
jgi:surface antigen